MYRTGVKQAKLTGLFMAVLQVIVWGIFIVVILIGAYLSHHHKIQIGDITAFLLMSMTLMTRFGLIGATFGAIMGMIGASVKIIMIMEHKPLVNIEGGIEPVK